MTTPEPLWDADKFLDRLSLHTWQSDPKQDNDFVTVGVAVFVAMQMQADYEAKLDELDMQLRIAVTALAICREQRDEAEQAQPSP